LTESQCQQKINLVSQTAGDETVAAAVVAAAVGAKTN